MKRRLYKRTDACLNKSGIDMNKKSIIVAIM